MSNRPTVVLGLLGTTLDAGRGPARWERWRPTVALCQHEDLVVDRLELLHAPQHEELAGRVADDVRQVSPETAVVLRPLVFGDAWDFERVYAALFDLAKTFPFAPEREDYLVHITTGSHVAQICLFLLAESGHLPARLLQTAPGKGEERRGPGSHTIIDLDLSRYDRLRARFEEEKGEAVSFLKAGIATRNARFNALVDEIEKVALASRAPMLLLGPTGSGKSRLARRVYELKRARGKVKGVFAEVNCATLRGDMAASALFGHTRGAFTGAAQSREGLLRRAHQGVVFLDEIGELGADEQALLLRAIEDRVVMPVGSDREIESDFQLLCGTNRDLGQAVVEGRFREDLLARIDLWTFCLPALRDRREDIAPNVEYELERATRELGRKVSLSRDASLTYLAFATSDAALWSANFRDLSASVTRMATLAPSGRIGLAEVEREISRLREGWSRERPFDPGARVRGALGDARAAALDRFDRVQLEDVLSVCAQARSLSSAGRVLYGESRKDKRSPNDADRLKKYLARFGLDFATLARTVDRNEST